MSFGLGTFMGRRSLKMPILEIGIEELEQRIAPDGGETVLPL